MSQPFLDLTNYDKPATPSDYSGMQDFLCNAPKTDGRLGFNPTSHFSGDSFVQSCTTPYGMQVMESHFIEAILTFNVFTYKMLKHLCESPLPDASVLNLVDNAIAIMMDNEPGDLTQFTMIHCGIINPYGHREHRHGKLTWSTCGCDCLIKWNGRTKLVSLEVASMIETTGRLKVIPLEECLCPRDGSMHELKYYPHPNAIDRFGKPITPEMIEAAVEARRDKRENKF